MIHYLVTAGHDRFTVRPFLRDWAPGLRGRLRVVLYEDLPALERADPGLWIFFDLERLRPDERARAAALHARLAAAGPAFRTLNDPARSLGRLALLEALAARGSNDFRAWPAGAGVPPDARFPVFVRAANAHDGSSARLLGGAGEVTPEVERILANDKRLQRDDLIGVEFCDTSAGSGTFRKYSAQRIGDAVLPRHLLFGEQWVVKRPGRLDEARLREEREFLATFPHRDAVRAAFDLARIDYGRIDYAVRGGRVQVFEINTNPVLVPSARRVAGSRRPLNVEFAAASRDALLAIADALPPGDPVPLDLAGLGARRPRRMSAAVRLAKAYLRWFRRP